MSPMTIPDRDELVDVELSDDERWLLNRGLVEWGGPAACTDAMANAMGFGSVRDLFEESERLLAALRARQALSRWDWTRMLIATEIVFASDVVGSGVEWTITTGLEDVHTLQVLRDLQRKLVKARTPVGPRPVL